MDKNWLVLLQQQNQLEKVMETNPVTARFGLSLSEQDAVQILEERSRALREQQRVEFNGGIVPRLIYEFCDSDYLDQNTYADAIIRLQEIFYLYKNETEDLVTDDELLHLMKEQFEQICFGDLDYLEQTCLANFAQAVRMGYRGYQDSEGHGEASHFDEVTRWDYNLYFEALKDLCWG